MSDSHENIQILFDKLVAAPFPAVGKVVGDFPLYDGYIAGFASRFLKGAFIPVDQLGLADEETLKYIAALRDNKNPLPQNDQAFLDYFQLLETLRMALDIEIQKSHHNNPIVQDPVYQLFNKLINLRGGLSNEPSIGNFIFYSGDIFERARDYLDSKDISNENITPLNKEALMKIATIQNKATPTLDEQNFIAKIEILQELQKALAQ